MSTPDYDKISRYADGEMDAEELQAFEQMLQQDAALKKEVDLFREVNDTLKTKLYPGKDELALQSTLEEMRQQYFHNTGAKIVQFRKYRWVAAVAAAAIIIALFIWSPWSQPDLYRQYASVEMNSVAERGTPADSLLQLVTQKFNDKNFEETIPLFETLLKTDEANSYLHFYYAVALLETGQVEKSRAELNQLYNGISIFRYDAAYFMALSYLRKSVPSEKEKDRVACIQWLNQIPEDASIYSKGQNLLMKLE